VLLFFFKLKEREMKKLIMALVVGSAMSTAAFAVEPAATPMALSDSQMDMVTAGGNRDHQSRPASTTQTNTNGDSINVGVNPTVAVVPINFGGRQTIGANNPQSSPTQVNSIRR
jgi:hypothetical protein